MGRMFAGVLGLLLVVGVAVAAPAQRETPGGVGADVRPWPHEVAGLPLREGVEVDALANGVRVAWKGCDSPPDRLRIWLHVAAGAAMEAPGEEGLAHLVEHMVFRGTAGWPDGAVDAWARDNGLLSGPDLNAFTDWRETIYLVDLPGGDARLLRQALSILRDFAAAPRFDAAAFAAEKAVVDAEERERLGGDGRAWAALERWSQAGLRVAERDLLGSPGTRAALTVEDLARFHARWYRPERLTVVLAGDLPADPRAVVERAFGDLRAAGSPWVEPPAGTPRAELGTLTHAVPEWSGANLVLRWNRPVAGPVWRDFDLARRQREALAWTILGRRLDRLVAEEPDVFQDAWTAVEPPLAETPFEAFEITLMVRGGEAWEPAVRQVRRELEALTRHGVPAHELASAQRLLLADLAASAAADAERTVEEEAEWLVAMAGDRSLDWSVDALRPALRAAIRESDSETVVALVDELLRRAPGLALVGDFAGEDVDRRLRAAWTDEPAEVEPRPWRAPPPFAYRAGAPGEVLARTAPDGDGVVDVRFANGVRLVHSPAAGTRVQVRAHLLGGRRTLTPERWPLAWVAEEVYLDLGLVAHDSEELFRICEAHDVFLELAVADEAVVLDGDAALEDLRLQCELGAAYLSAPAWSASVWEAMRAEHAERWAELATDLEASLWVRFWPELLTPSGLSWIPTPEEMARLELADFRAWLEPQLGRAPLVVVVWGGTTDQVVADVAATFGALAPRADAARVLPAPGAAEAAGPRGGVAREYEVEGEADRALVYLTVAAGDEGVPSRGWATKLLVPAVQERLDARLRDELGLTYGAQVNAYVSSTFPALGYVEIRVLVAPSLAERARDECLEILAALAREGVHETELATARAQALAVHAEADWMDLLSRRAHAPGGLRSWVEEGRFYRDVREARVQRHARRLFRPDRVSTAILRPPRR